MNRWNGTTGDTPFEAIITFDEQPILLVRYPKNEGIAVAMAKCYAYEYNRRKLNPHQCSQGAVIMEHQTKNYINSSKYPIRFDKLHPGSLFKIHAERSRDMKYSKDQRVYRRAQNHEGFYAYNIANNQPACLYPEDMVQPVREVK